MKIDFPLPTDGQCHQYCVTCRSEDVHRVFEGAQTFYLCNRCGQKSPRMIVIDPKVVSWVDAGTGDYWHESVGVFLFNDEGKALFFERLIYPFALAIPAGHLDVGEGPRSAATRELEEETGVVVDDVRLFCEEPVAGDECRRGSDHHAWHLFVARARNGAEARINDEGLKPVWLTLEEAMRHAPVLPVRHFIEKYGDALRVGDEARGG